MLENTALTCLFRSELDSACRAQGNPDDNIVDRRVVVPANAATEGVPVDYRLDQLAFAERCEFCSLVHYRHEFFWYWLAFPQDTGTVVVAKPEVAHGAS